MAKRVAKRETNAERGGYKEFRCNGFTVMVPRSVSKVWGKNAERRLREDVHRFVVRHARMFAGAIRALMKDKSPLAPKEMENLPAKKLKRMGYHPKSKMVREYYADLGEVFCLFHGDVPEFLRLVVNILERKPPLPGPYDDKIKAAYEKAMPPVRVLPNRELVAAPTFPEFLKVYREQNPKMEVEERSLRRSLRRLGLPLHSRRNRMVPEPGVEYFAYTDLMKCVERLAAGELPGL